MGIKAKSIGIFRGSQICKNSQYAMLNLSLEEEYRGSEIIPAEPNARVLIKSSELNDYTMLSPGECYLFDMEVSVGSNKDKERRPDLNFQIKSAKAYRSNLPIFGSSNAQQLPVPSASS